MAYKFMLLAAACLTGCTSFDQMSSTQQAATIQKSGEYCQKIGFIPGTNSFVNCIHGKIISNDANVRNRRAAAGAGLVVMGASYQRSARRSVNCRSTRSIDGSIGTYCY